MRIQMLSAWGGEVLASNASTVALFFGSAAVVVALCSLLRFSKESARQTTSLALSLVATIAGVTVLRVIPFPFPVYLQLGLVLIGVGWTLLIVFLTNAELNLCSSYNGTNSRLPYSIAWLVLGLSTAIKCLDLDAWPAEINDYAAMHGVAGIEYLEKGFPARWYQAGPNDLAGGGGSPLFFPVQFMLMKIFGPTLLANRLSEVIGSSILLIVFLQWVMSFVGGTWGLLAFSLFALSPWHLAQSRLGTYQSISMAVGMMLLLCGTKVLSGVNSRGAWGWWIGVALATGLLGYCYAPLRIMYLFTALILALHIFRNLPWRLKRDSTTTCCTGTCETSRQSFVKGVVAPVSFVILSSIAFLSIQTSGPDGVGRMFTTSMGWASDTATWHKTLSHRIEDDVVTRELQPLGVILSHWLVNSCRLASSLFQLNSIDVLLAPFFVAGAFLACAWLVRGRELLFSSYYILGILPALIINPMLRRSSAMWSLISVAGVIFVRELVRGALIIWSNRLWNLVVTGMISVGSLSSILHGLHLFATTNSELGLGAPFWAPGRIEMITRILEIAPTCDVYMVNEFEHQYFARLALYQPLKSKGLSYQSIVVTEGQKIQPPALSGKPACFVILNEQRRRWIAPFLRENLPGGNLESSTTNPNAPFPEFQIYYYPRPGQLRP